MKKYPTLAAPAPLLAACSEKPGYKTNGTVANINLNGKYVYLYEYDVQDIAPMDSALVQNGTFMLKGTQSTPVLCKLAFAGDVMEPRRAASGENAPFAGVLVLESGKLQAVLDKAAPAVSGTPENDGLKALQAQMKTLRADLEKLPVDVKFEDKKVISATEKKYDEIDQKVTDTVETYMSNSMTKQSAVKLLYNLRYSLDEAIQNEIIAKTDSTFKAVPSINKLMARLGILRTVAVGRELVDFEMADLNGKTHGLSELVGNDKNIVLIDFWTSWYPPCRRDMPGLVAAYKKYRNKGFETADISLGNRTDAQVRGVKDPNIIWTQLSDLQGWENSGAQLYGINSIPHTVLVDKDGTIITGGLHGGEVDAKFQEILK